MESRRTFLPIFNFFFNIEVSHLWALSIVYRLGRSVSVVGWCCRQRHSWLQPFAASQLIANSTFVSSPLQLYYRKCLVVNEVAVTPPLHRWVWQVYVLPSALTIRYHGIYMTVLVNMDVRNKDCACDCWHDHDTRGQ